MNLYYLHRNENPTPIHVSPPLDRTNYDSWIFSRRLTLLSKNKLKFADETLEQPSPTDLFYYPWVRCNSMVLSSLLKSISLYTAKSIIWYDRVAVVSKDLQYRFDQSKIFKIYDLQDELSKFQQGTLDISSYYTAWKILWEEIDTFRLFRDCSCAIPCTCRALSDVKDYRE